jgi:hypothetical protein
MEKQNAVLARKVVANNGSKSGADEAINEIDKGIKTETARRSLFVTSVMSISEDRSRAKVKLCTGRVLDVPTSLLTNVTDLGTVADEERRWGVAAGEIDVSTDAGALIQQMALEITRLSRSLRTAQGRLQRLQNTDTTKSVPKVGDVSAVLSKTTAGPLDIVRPETAVKITTSGVAGYLKQLWYTAPAYNYIQSFTIAGIENGFLTKAPSVSQIVHSLPRTGEPIQYEFEIDAAHGTPLGVPYDAVVTCLLVLVQMTT